MNALIIGGARHGEWIDVLDGSTAWVDIRTADTYRVRKLGWGITQLNEQGQMLLTGESYRLVLLVHPDLTITGPQAEQQIVTQLMQMLAMNDFIRAHGDLEKPDVPDSPATLFGPDGEALS